MTLAELTAVIRRDYAEGRFQGNAEETVGVLLLRVQELEQLVQCSADEDTQALLRRVRERDRERQTPPHQRR